MVFRQNGLSFAAKIFALVAFFAPAFAFAAADCSGTSAATVGQTECEALMQIYNSTGGASWRRTNNWDTAADVCTWDGISCGGGHVTQLDLGGDLMTGTFPDVLDDLPNLTLIDIGANQLSGAFPSTIGSLPSLQYLYFGDVDKDNDWIDDNNFTGAFPSGVFSDTNLIVVVGSANGAAAGGNQFDSGNISNIGNLTHLTNFSCQYCGLSGAIPSGISGAASLATLDLRNNSLTSIPSELGSLTSLSTFWLANNSLAGSIPDTFQVGCSLTLFVADHNQLTGSIPDSLRNCTALMWLHLGSNRLSGSIPDIFGNMNNFRSLDIGNQDAGYGHLTGSIPASLGTRTTLQALRVPNEALTGSLPANIGTGGIWTNLVHMQLGNNQLSGTLPAGIVNLNTLDILDIGGNQFNCEIPAAMATGGNLTGLKNNSGYDYLNLADNKLYATDSTLITWLNSRPSNYFWGSQDNDADGDSAYDCAGVDDCPADADKTEAGICGCGVADTDTDGDGTPDCNDSCPNDEDKLVAGVCGCGVADTDTDSDGTLDCNDACPEDPDKIAAGLCGCGNADVDANNDSVCDTSVRFSVGGYVYTKNGEPLSGVTVHSRAGAAVTNAEGYYVINNIAPDTGTSPAHAKITFYIREWDEGYSISRRFNLSGVSGRSCPNDDTRDNDSGRTEKCKFSPLYIDQDLTNMNFKVNRCVNPSSTVKYYEDANQRCIRENTLPSKPTGLTATNGTSTRGVDLSWSITPSASTYKILRTTADTTVTSSSTVVGETISTTFTDRSAIPGVQYKYAVMGVNRTGNSPISNPVVGSRQATGGVEGEGDTPTDSDGDGVSDDQESHDQTDPMDRGSNLATLTSPAFTKYNTYLSQYNFLELIGSGTHTVHGTITLYGSDGAAVGSPIPFDVEPNSEIDVDIHSRVPADSYGLVKVDFNDDDAGVHLMGRMTVYRQDPDLEALPASEQTYSFAFTRSLRNPIRGTTFATANSFDPQGMGYLVPNWVEIINADSTQHGFTVRLYRQDGSLANEKTGIVVSPHGEYDVQGGHEYGEGVYLVEVSPDDGDAKYFATVVRYSSNSTAPGEAQTYNFAMPIDARAGSGDQQFVPISNEVGSQNCSGGNLAGNPSWVQSNWLELINVLSETVTVAVKFRTSGGEIVGETSATLSPHSQEHLNAASLLPAGSAGFAEINPDKENSVLAQSNVYYHDNCGANQLDTAYSSAAAITGTNEQIGSYNRFLNMQNFLTIINASNEAINANLQIMQGSRGKVGDAQVSLTPHMCTTLDLSDNSQFSTLSDTYGTMSLETTANRKVIAENLRYREVNGVPDFAIATQVR